MKLKTSLPVVLLLALAMSAYAQGATTAAPLSLEITPAASIPLLDSGQQFSTGSVVELSGLLRLPFLPIAFLNAELGLGSLPLKATSSVSVLSAGMGGGVELELSSSLSVNLRASGGYYWGYLASSTIQSGGGNPYVYGGAGLDLLLSPEIGLGFELGYRNYIGVYQGLETALRARVLLGGPDWVANVQSAGAGVQPLSIEITPAASVPLMDSAQQFETGTLVELSGLFHLPFFPLAFLNAELGYGDLPLKASSSVSVLSAGAGTGVELGLLPWLSVKVRGSAGFYYGTLAGSATSGGNPYLYGGAGLDVAATQDIGVGFELGYRDYIGVYQGLEAALGARIHMGGEGWTQRVQPAGAVVQPLSLEITPAASIPLLGSGEQFITGSTTQLSGLIRLPFLPIAFFSGELGFGSLPLKAASSVSVLSAGAGAGVELGLLPWLSVNLRGSAGYYYSFLADSTLLNGGGNPYLYGGAGLSFAISPELGVGLEVGYRSYIGVYQGLETALSTRLALGGPAQGTGGAVQQQPLPQKPTPLVSTPEQTQQAQPGKGLEMTKIDVKDIYPVFYKFYDDHAIGTAALHNWEKSPVQNVRLSVYVKEYMDNPKEAKGPDKIDPGADVSVDLYGLFKKNILDNTEDTKVSANISMTYTLNGKDFTYNSVQTVTVLKRNALTWDDDRKAAAFVSLNDPTVARFARNVAAIVNGKGNQAVEPNLRLAAALHDALTLYGITYINTDVTTLNSDNKTVDRIQFPQETLDYRSGKCSDFSALYAAMFEAAGLETAFITIPGHIYMAVALTMSPDDARAAFTHKDDLIIDYNGDGKVWLPIEITLRDGGFMAAWQLGAKEWRENLAKKQAVLYPLHAAWKIYEPVGYSSTALDIKIPADDKIILAYNNDVDAFVKNEMGQQEVVLLAAVNKATTTAAKSKSINSLAVLHSRFGLYDQAIKEFQQVLAKDEYVPSLINIGNIYFMQGNNDKALEFYNRAAVKAPKNPVVLLCVARANHALENYSIAKKAYADLQAADPELASKFAYLDLRGEEATRAADAAGVSKEVIWQQDQ